MLAVKIVRGVNFAKEEQHGRPQDIRGASDWFKGRASAALVPRTETPLLVLGKPIYYSMTFWAIHAMYERLKTGDMVLRSSPLKLMLHDDFGDKLT